MKYYLGAKIGKNEISRACGPMGKRRGVYKVLAGQPEGN